LVPLAVGLIGPPARAQTLYYDRASFLGDAAITTTSSINFDDLLTGRDLTNATIDGVTFQAPGTSPLLVTEGSIRFVLSPSTPPKVLSPGGNDPSAQNDDLMLVFDNPVRAAGLDVVYDVPDGLSFVSVTFMDKDGHTLASNGFIPSPSGAPGYGLVGCVSTTGNIKRILFNEFDGSAPDDNVAYDSIVLSPGVTPVPEGGSLAGLLPCLVM
jgi:hypothetical protein